MTGAQQGFEDRAERVADDERKIQKEIEAKEKRSFKADDDAPPQTGAGSPARDPAKATMASHSAALNAEGQSQYMAAP